MKKIAYDATKEYGVCYNSAQDIDLSSATSLVVADIKRFMKVRDVRGKIVRLNKMVGLSGSAFGWLLSEKHQDKEPSDWILTKDSPLTDLTCREYQAFVRI